MSGSPYSVRKILEALQCQYRSYAQAYTGIGGSCYGAQHGSGIRRWSTAPQKRIWKAELNIPLDDPILPIWTKEQSSLDVSCGYHVKPRGFELLASTEGIRLPPHSGIDMVSLSMACSFIKWHTRCRGSQPRIIFFTGLPVAGWIGRQTPLSRKASGRLRKSRDDQVIMAISGVLIPLSVPIWCRRPLVINWPAFLSIMVLLRKDEF